MSNVKTELLSLADFTPEIESKIPEYLKKYTEGIYDGARYRSFNEEKAQALIDWNYTQCDLLPPVMLVAENPYEAQVYFNILKANQEYYTPFLYLLYCLQHDLDIDWFTEYEDAKLHDNLRDKLYAKMDTKLRAKMDDKLDAKLRAKLAAKLAAKMDTKLRDKLRAKLCDKLNAKLDAKMDDKLDAKLNDNGLERFSDYLFTANIWSNVYAAYYKFIKDEFSIDIEEGPLLDTWSNLYLDSGVYSAIFSELVCIVSKYPKKIHIDRNNEMHCLTGKAIEWGCEMELTSLDSYYIHGRAIEDKIFEKAATLQQSDFINETNDEVRSAWFEILGDEKIIQLLEAEKIDSIQLIHKNGEIETIEYYRTKENLNIFRNEPYAWRKFKCPSTGSIYFTPTNPALKTALEVAKYHRPDWVPNEIDYSWYSRS